MNHNTIWQEAYNRGWWKTAIPGVTDRAAEAASQVAEKAGGVAGSLAEKAGHLADKLPDMHSGMPSPF